MPSGSTPTTEIGGVPAVTADCGEFSAADNQQRPVHAGRSATGPGRQRNAGRLHDAGTYRQQRPNPRTVPRRDRDRRIDALDHPSRRRRRYRHDNSRLGRRLGRQPDGQDLSRATHRDGDIPAVIDADKPRSVHDQHHTDPATGVRNQRRADPRSTSGHSGRHGSGICGQRQTLAGQARTGINNDKTAIPSSETNFTGSSGPEYFIVTAAPS